MHISSPKIKADSEIRVVARCWPWGRGAGTGSKTKVTFSKSNRGDASGCTCAWRAETKACAHQPKLRAAHTTPSVSVVGRAGGCSRRRHDAPASCSPPSAAAGSCSTRRTAAAPPTASAWPASKGSGGASRVASLGPRWAWLARRAGSLGEGTGGGGGQAVAARDGGESVRRLLGVAAGG